MSTGQFLLLSSPLELETLEMDLCQAVGMVNVTGLVARVGILLMSLSLGRISGLVERHWASWRRPAATIALKHALLSSSLMKAEGTYSWFSGFLEAWEWRLGGSCSSESLYPSGEISEIDEISSWWSGCCSGFLMASEKRLEGNCSLELLHFLSTLSEPKKMSCLSAGLPKDWKGSE